MSSKRKQPDAIAMKRRAQAQVRAELAGKSKEEEISYYAAVNERWRKGKAPAAAGKRAK